MDSTSEQGSKRTLEDAALLSSTSVEVESDVRAILADKRRGPHRKDRQVNRWSAEEDQRLQEAVALHGAKSWKLVATMVPGRDHTQCLQRWSKCLAPGLRKGTWTLEEDDQLMKCVRTQLELISSKGGDVRQKKIPWGDVCKQIPGRTAKQCRERWVNNLDPIINKGAWTREEDDKMTVLYRKYGPSWAAIAKEMSGRTENGVKIRWKTLSRTKEGIAAARDAPTPLYDRPAEPARKHHQMDGGDSDDEYDGSHPRFNNAMSQMLGKATGNMHGVGGAYMVDPNSMNMGMHPQQYPQQGMVPAMQQPQQYVPAIQQGPMVSMYPQSGVPGIFPQQQQQGQPYQQQPQQQYQQHYPQQQQQQPYQQQQPMQFQQQQPPMGMQQQQQQPQFNQGYQQYPQQQQQPGYQPQYQQAPMMSTQPMPPMQPQQGQQQPPHQQPQQQQQQQPGAFYGNPPAVDASTGQPMGGNPPSNGFGMPSYFPSGASAITSTSVGTFPFSGTNVGGGGPSSVLGANSLLNGTSSMVGPVPGMTQQQSSTTTVENGASSGEESSKSAFETNKSPTRERRDSGASGFADAAPKKGVLNKLPSHDDAASTGSSSNDTQSVDGTSSLPGSIMSGFNSLASGAFNKGPPTLSIPAAQPFTSQPQFMPIGSGMPNQGGYYAPPPQQMQMPGLQPGQMQFAPAGPYAPQQQQQPQQGQPQPMPQEQQAPPPAQ